MTVGTAAASERRHSIRLECEADIGQPPIAVFAPLLSGSLALRFRVLQSNNRFDDVCGGWSG